MRAWIFLGLVACGGSIADPIGDGGSSTDSTTTMDRAVEDSPVRVDAPVTDCKSMEAKLAAMREQVLTCCPFCNSIQCNHVTQDVCCPISTTATNVGDFEALVKEYKAQCMPACPAIPCPKVPSMICKPGANPNAPGTCQ